MRRPVRVVVSLLAAVTLAAVAGCTATEPPVRTGEPPAGGPPSPAGAAEVTEVPGATTDTSCDPTASLRPAGPLPAPGDLPPGSTMARIRANGKLVVGVDQNTYHFGFRNPRTGTIEGFDLDMAHEVAEALFGRPDAIQLRVLTSSQRIDALRNGDVDLVVQTMSITCDRWQDIDFSSMYYEARQRVLVKSDSGHTGLESLGGKKVCASKGSTSLANIVNARSKPIGVQVPGWTDCLVMLQQNQVDAVSTDDTILAGLAAQDPFTKVVGGTISSEPYGMGIAKGRTDFVRFVNAVLERVRSDGTWEDSYDRWLADLLDEPGKPPAPRYRD
jgi:polar amino acid transport system substrate-binding protein